MAKISPIVRITFGMLLLTVSVLLIADMLGMVPNQNKAQIDARKAVAESLAIQVSSQLGAERLPQILSNIVKRNDEIRSVGLREASGHLLIESAGHADSWQGIGRNYSTATEVLVPIFNSAGRWGTLEVAFTPLPSFWQALLSGKSLLSMLLFLVILGGLSYWLFLKRVLSELDPKSAVPGRVRTALDMLVEGIVILDQSERIVLVNRAFEDKIGLTEEELFGKNLASLEWIQTENDEMLSSEKLPWTELFETNKVPPLRHMKLKSETKGILTIDINVAPIYANEEMIRGVIVTINDVTLLDKKNSELAHTLQRLKISQEEIVRQNIELVELATRDPLTHVLNRRSLFDGFDKLLEESHHQKQQISCIIMDIDHFKLVNDNYGHAVGDQVIKEVANALRDMAPSDGLVGRYGGEEFVVVLPSYDEANAATWAEEMRLEMQEKQIVLGSTQLQITCSFGVATAHDLVTSDALVDQADQALYKAKESGRNQVIRYSLMDNLVQEKIEVQRKPRTRITQINQVKQSLIQLSDQGAASELLDHDVMDADGKLSIDAFDMMGNSSRVVVIDRLTQAIKIAKRKQTQLAVLTIFIDTIQTINNTIGFGSAEKLRRVAYQRLNKIFRDSDSVLPEKNKLQGYSLSRSGDSEFTAILNDLEDIEMVTWITQRMFADLKQAVDIDGTEVIMTANVGVSFYPDDGATAETLMANSNLALEEANKLDEKESLMIFNQEMNGFSRKQLEIEGLLYQAIDKDEFTLYYQPIVSLKTGRVEKLEALIRWQHPELGIVSPDSFIGIAENSGVIKMIGFWIVETAAKQLKRLHAAGFGHLKMSVNISAAQFNQAKLSQKIIKLVEQVGLPFDSIVFEITETAIIKRYDRTIQEITTLSEAGFEIALDDFGTGYSSLDFLRKFPIDWVKIDRSFMLDFPKDINDVSIVSGLIGLSHNLGMRVIAEGVEEEQQIATLMDLGCDQIQGFFVARPLTTDQLQRYLIDNKSAKLIREIKSNQANADSNWDTLSVINAVINHHKS